MASFGVAVVDEEVGQLVVESAACFIERDVDEQRVKLDDAFASENPPRCGAETAIPDDFDAAGECLCAQLCKIRTRLIEDGLELLELFWARLLRHGLRQELSNFGFDGEVDQVVNDVQAFALGRVEHARKIWGHIEVFGLVLGTQHVGVA